MRKVILSVILGASVIYSVNVLAKNVINKNNEVKIEGIVQSLPANFIGSWTVNNKAVEINNTTKIEGQKSDFKKGATVELEGYYLNNKFITEEMEIKGHETNDDKENGEKEDDEKDEK